MIEITFVNAPLDVPPLATVALPAIPRPDDVVIIGSRDWTVSRVTWDLGGTDSGDPVHVIVTVDDGRGFDPA